MGSKTTKLLLLDSLLQKMAKSPDLTSLHAMFCKHGTCRDPRSEGEVDSLVAPTEIKEMLRLSSGWHLTSDYWGVNLFKDWNEDEADTSEEKTGMWMDKTIIIGDAEM